MSNEKTFFINKVLVSSISFSDVDGNQATLKILSDSELIDIAIKFLGKKVRVTYNKGVVQKIENWDIYFERNKELFKMMSVPNFYMVENGLLTLKEAQDLKR